MFTTPNDGESYTEAFIRKVKERRSGELERGIYTPEMWMWMALVDAVEELNTLVTLVSGPPRAVEDMRGALEAVLDKEMPGWKNPMDPYVEGCQIEDPYA